MRISRLSIISSLVLSALVVASLFVSSLASPAQASGLTDAQIQAIVSLLSSFGADSSVIANVNATLHGQATTGGSTPSGSPSGSCVSITHNLSVGVTDSSTGGEVTRLQQFLGVSATGYYGSLTAQAVIKWQAAHGIAQVGTVGPATRTSFACSPAVPITPTIPTTPTTPPLTTPTPPVVPPISTTTATTTPTATTPSCVLTTDKTTYYFNDQMNISWTSQNATYVTFTPSSQSGVLQLPIYGSYGTQGSIIARAIVSGTPRITLNVFGANGTGTCTTTVTVRNT